MPTETQIHRVRLTNHTAVCQTADPAENLREIIFSDLGCPDPSRVEIEVTCLEQTFPDLGSETPESRRLEDAIEASTSAVLRALYPAGGPDGLSLEDLRNVRDAVRRCIAELYEGFRLAASQRAGSVRPRVLFYLERLRAQGRGELERFQTDVTDARVLQYLTAKVWEAVARTVLLPEGAARNTAVLEEIGAVLLVRGAADSESPATVTSSPIPTSTPTPTQTALLERCVHGRTLADIAVLVESRRRAGLNPGVNFPIEYWDLVSDGLRYALECLPGTPAPTGAQEISRGLASSILQIVTDGTVAYAERSPLTTHSELSPEDSSPAEDRRPYQSPATRIIEDPVLSAEAPLVPRRGPPEDAPSRVDRSGGIPAGAVARLDAGTRAEVIQVVREVLERELEPGGMLNLRLELLVQGIRSW